MREEGPMGDRKEGGENTKLLIKGGRSEVDFINSIKRKRGGGN